MNNKPFNADDLVRWRDWLLDYVPRDVMDAGVWETLEQRVNWGVLAEFIRYRREEDSHYGLAGTPQPEDGYLTIDALTGPLDFFLWGSNLVLKDTPPDGLIGEGHANNFQLRDYLETWFGDWWDVFLCVVANEQLEIDVQAVTCHK